jgi:hypothetical protein
MQPLANFEKSFVQFREMCPPSRRKELQFKSEECIRSPSSKAILQIQKLFVVKQVKSFNKKLKGLLKILRRASGPAPN